MLADEDIEVSVTWQQVQRMTARLLPIEPGKGLLLTLRQETAIVLASKEDEPRVGTWRIDAEAWRQGWKIIYRHQMAGQHATIDLLKKTDRDFGELLLDPVMGRRAQIGVAP